MNERKHQDLQAADFRKELAAILDFWSTAAFDSRNKRFYGKVDNQNKAFPDAPLGAVLSARILWSFSAAFLVTGREQDREMAGHAWRNFERYFIDREAGGVYWKVSASGEPLDDRKQVYAIAFAIYALSEYFKVTGGQFLLDHAISFFRLVGQHSYDRQRKGYLEAFSRHWGDIPDQRLSKKDRNEKKTLNTHLHLLEAYTNLYRIWPDQDLKEQIEGLLDCFTNYFIDAESGHLLLFHDEDWQSASLIRSFGHDVEASWLLCEAASLINDGVLPEDIRAAALVLAQAAAEGMNLSGALLYEFDPSAGRGEREKHWWVQAEAIVGFQNAFSLSGDEIYTRYAASAWKYAREWLIDPIGGEWYWGRDERGHLVAGRGKVDFWKGPYHQTRCCLEMIRRLAR